MTADQPWWATAFAAHYRTIYAHRDDDAAREEMTALLPLLRTMPGPVLDVGCGHGRHLEVLRAAGLDVFGLDYSRDLLADARLRGPCQGRLLRADMQQPPVASGWGAVLMLFTSFGYFDDDANRACLAAWGRLLAPGGRLIIDLPEVQHLAATLQASTCRRGADGQTISECRRLRDGRVEKSVRLHRDEKTLLEYTESVRLYDQDAFTALVDATGLTVIDCWKSLRGPSQDDHRLVWFLGKAAGC